VLYIDRSTMNILRVKRKCLALLERVESEGAYLHIMLQREAERRSDAPEEYPVIVQLVRGVLEQRQALESILEPLLPKGLASLPVQVQLVLKLGAYQLRFLDRVKQRDVVFEAVELVKEGRWKGLAGLVNAVLRKVGPMVVSQEDAPSRSRVVNFPAWLLERWEAQFGASEVSAFCEASDKKLPLYIRINSNSIDGATLRGELLREGIETEPVNLSPAALRIVKLPQKVRIQDLSTFKRGLFFIQDLSSAIVADLVSSTKPSTVRDICAAPGGKTCSIALSIQAHSGRVLASDRVESRVALVKDLITRLRIRNVDLSVWDACSFSSSQMSSESSEVKQGSVKTPDTFDVVLVDAPCSGFGTVGRKVDVRWSKSEAMLQELIALQADILDSAAHLVKPSGYLVYSTCTIDRDENEGSAESFLSRNVDFRHAPVQGLIPSAVCTEEGYYRAWPQHHSMAGAFAAMFMKSPG